jgi:hypothetical protein
LNDLFVREVININMRFQSTFDCYDEPIFMIHCHFGKAVFLRLDKVFFTGGEIGEGDSGCLVRIKLKKSYILRYKQTYLLEQVLSLVN